MYKGCLPFSYMTKPCNHRGTNVTDSKLPECTYEFNSCKVEDGLGSGRRKRSEGESGGCLAEANGWEYRGSVSETASGKYGIEFENTSFLSCILYNILFNENWVQQYLEKLNCLNTGQCCMKWSVKGNGYDTGSYVDEYGTGDHNFCRYSNSLCSLDQQSSGTQTGQITRTRGATDSLTANGRIVRSHFVEKSPVPRCRRPPAPPLTVSLRTRDSTIEALKARLFQAEQT